MTTYEKLSERLRQAKSSFESGRKYEVWVSRDCDVATRWPDKVDSIPGYRLAGVFTAAVKLDDLIEAALYAVVEAMNA